MKKNLLLLAMFLFFSTSSPLFAAGNGAPKSNGVGFIIGDPTGITGKFWTSSRNAIDIGMAFSFNSFVLLYGDYLFHFHGAFGTDSAFLSRLEPYVGVGTEILFVQSTPRKNTKYYNDAETGLGVRIPFGAEWFMPDAPLALFVELVPGIGLVPGTFSFFQGGVGARFYF